MFPFFYLQPQLPLKAVVGADYRKRGETLSWRLVEAEEDRVVLSGPGACRGLLYLDRSEFNRDWSRV